MQTYIAGLLLFSNGLSLVLFLLIQRDSKKYKESQYRILEKESRAVIKSRSFPVILWVYFSFVLTLIVSSYLLFAYGTSF